MRPNRFSPRTKRSSWILASIPFIVAVTGIVAIVFYALKAQSTRIALDPQTQCPAEELLSSVTAVLIDTSDSLSEAQRTDIRNQLETVQLNVPKYGALELYVLSDEGGALLKPTIRLCNPGDGSDINQMTGNERIAHRRWKQGFIDRIQNALTLAINTPESASSPIMESIQAVALNSFGGAIRGELPHSLIIVSDLIQNTPGQYSQYRDSLDFGRFKQTDFYAHARVNLRGTEVTLLYLRRTASRSLRDSDHISFWQHYFVDNGASIKRVLKISG